MGENKRRAMEVIENVKNLPRQQQLDILLLFLISISEWKHSLYVKACNICVEQYANANNDCHKAVELIRARITELFEEAQKR